MHQIFQDEHKILLRNAVQCFAAFWTNKHFFTDVVDLYSTKANRRLPVECFRSQSPYRRPQPVRVRSGGETCQNKNIFVT